MKLVINELQLVIIVLQLANTYQQQSNNSPPKAFTTRQLNNEQLSYPKLLYLIPKNANSEYQLNEKSTFTNKIISGWVLESDKNYEIIVYFLVDAEITSLAQISNAYIYFTTNLTHCNYDHSNLKSNSNDKEEGVFKLNLVKEKSKLHEKNSIVQLNARDTRNANSNTNTNNLNTLVVAEFDASFKHSSDKYFTCLSVSYTNNEKFAATANQTANNFLHQGTTNVFTQVITTRELLPIYLVVFIYFALLCLSALFSGLNLGLMSLDLTELDLLKKVGSRNEKKYARKIYPLRRHGNQLLCTILLGNVLVNSSSTLILGNYVQGLFAAFGSTLLIVLFGEIIPQSICSRHGLAIGAYTRHITYFFMIMTFVLSYPLGKILNYFLGKEIAISLSRDKVREMMRQAKDNKNIEDKQFKLITGALDFKHKSVKDIMVPIKDVFSLDINSILDFDTFKKILYHGYSRIPVYEFTNDNFVGMILIQDLLLNDPADKVPLRAVMDYYKHPVPKCYLNDSLEKMFDKFRKGDSHMAFVYNSSNFLDNNKADANLSSASEGNETTNTLAPAEVVGILTLENIIEELVQSEIMDEADNKREKRRKKAKGFLKGKLANISLSNENLNMFVTEVDQTSQPIISPQIRKALFYFLASSVRPFTGEFIAPKTLEALLRQPELTREKRNLSGDDMDMNMYLYKYGVPCDYFIIILDGSAIVQVGKEGMEINAGLFSYYGVNALLEDHEKDPIELILANRDPNHIRQYKPEFSLKVNSYCVYLKITRDQWADAVKKSLMERTYGIMSPQQLPSPQGQPNQSITHPLPSITPLKFQSITINDALYDLNHNVYNNKIENQITTSNVSINNLSNKN